jgi:hypothetical protein
MTGVKRLLGTIADPSQNNQTTTIFGEQIVTVQHASLLESFQYHINTKTIMTTVTNGGTVTQNDSMAILSSSTATNGSARIETKKRLRYRPGSEGYAIFTTLFENGGVAGATQFAGIFDNTDGYFLGFNGTDFCVGRRKDSVNYLTTDVNQDFLAKYDPTKLNIFVIKYAWLGTTPITFYWLDNSGKWIQIKRLDIANTLTAPSISNPQLPMAVEVIKTSGASDIVIKTGSWNCGTSQENPDIGNSDFSWRASATGVTTENVLVNFRNKTTFQGVTNKVRITLLYMSGSSDGTKPASIKVYKNLAIGGTPSWSSRDSNSIMEIDTAGTVTPNINALEFSLELGKTDSIAIELFKLDIHIDPTETLTVTGESANASDLVFFLRWHEQF